MEGRAQLEEGPDTAPDLNHAFVRPFHPREQTKKGRFACAVGPDDADGSSRLNIERDLMQGPKALAAHRPKPMKGCLFEGVRAVGSVTPVSLADLTAPDGVVHHSSSEKR